MKKTLYILFIAVLFGSCSAEFDDITYTVTNDSSKNIEFSFNDSLVNLGANESESFNINSGNGRFVPKNIRFTGHPRSINLAALNKGTAGIIYTFSDNTPLILNVENKLSIPVIIKAGDFIGASAETGDDAYDNTLSTLIIKEKTTETALIYTSAPNFSVQECDETERTIDDDNPVFIPYPYPFPISLNWELKNNTINVTIK